MRVHFIAIGGSAMHNLALALHENGFEVSGSDDEVFEPSRSRLAARGLLPAREGWQPELITRELDAIILGMHARQDNPELLRAQELGLKVYSYPEYLYEQCRDKTRVVIGGSHGKTTVTSMIMHALRFQGVDFDYMVGAQLEGFDTMVRLSKTAKIAVFEGDEYLSSPIDLRPKFLWYRPHLALLTGVAWDHINVFPTEEGYNEQFRLFADTVDENGYLTWFSGDFVLQKLFAESTWPFRVEPYSELEQAEEDGPSRIWYGGRSWPVPVFGAHNRQNMAGALKVCQQLGLSAGQFLEAMASFKGAARRLQVLREKSDAAVFYDFAHAPSKLRASIAAVKEQYPGRRLLACMELHTFSSLSKDFLPQYQGTMALADEALVYFNPQVLAHKRLPVVSAAEVAQAFGLPETAVVTSNAELLERLRGFSLQEANLLIMTSGNFGGLKVQDFVAEELNWD
ncbi:MAG TPA: peptidoglycan synthetase [Bacteroidales bacterium]|nr:peptidoglycan synthetase [Bacteroidales bacterium]